MKLRYTLFLVISLFWAVNSWGQQYIDSRLIGPEITRDAEIIPTGETNAVCIANTGTVAPAISLCATVNLTGKTVYYKPPEVTISALPSNHGIAIVTDAANATTCATGGGSTKVPCWWNGSAWTPLAGSGGGGSGDVTDVLGTTNEICMTNSSGPQPTAALCSTVSILAKTLQLGRLELAGDITPTTLAANTNDWNPTNLATASTIRATASASVNLTGLQGGSDGRILTLYLTNASSPITLLNENSSSSAANRFRFGADISLLANQGVVLQYDSSDQRWRVLGGIASGLDYCITSGGGSAYTCNMSPALNAYTVGKRYSFLANAANSGAVTIAMNGLAAIPIKKPVGGVSTDLITNDIRSGQIVEISYDGTQFQMLSTLGNSPTGIAGLTTGCIPKAGSSTTLGDSAACEDSDSINVSKNIEVGSVGTNAWWFDGTGVTGQTSMKFQTVRTKSITFRIGSDTGAALVDTLDEKDVWENNIAAMHITVVKCRTDAGTSTINLQRNDGTPANILSSNLSCTTGGATSSSFTSGEDAIAIGHMIDFVMVSAGGTAKRITVSITALIDAGS